MADGFGIVMAEMELPGGIKFKGGKIFVVLTALTTLGGKSRDVKDIQKEIKDAIDEQNKSSTDRMTLMEEIAEIEKQEGMRTNGRKKE